MARAAGKPLCYMSETPEKLTPMFAQWKSIKKDYPDALLFFRMGDFYELFFDDAVTASRELQIALTTRGKSGANQSPMCGVPWHASQSYLAQLIDKGYNVAICEQVGDPKTAKGLVKRAVTGVITPGTILDETNLEAKRHNYLGSVFCGLHNDCAFAWADISTGQWSGIEFRRQADLWQWVRKLNPRELILVDGQRLPVGFNQEGIRLVHQPAVNFELKRAVERLLASQGVREAEALGLEGKQCLARACGAMLAYLEQTQMRKPDQLMPFQPLDLGRRMLIDELTERNLEIFSTLNGRKGRGTLRHVLDATATPMGGRMLEDMLRHPWRDSKVIRHIQQCVSFLHDNDNLRASLRSALEAVYDLERIIMRICLHRSTVRDFLSLRQSIMALPGIISSLSSQPSLPDGMASLIENFDDLSDCAELLQSALQDEPPANASEGGIFRQGYNAELDRQLELLEHGEQKLRELLEQERQHSGINKLRLGYNRVFGYYYEAPKSSLGNDLPEHFTRTQTLANTERFSSEALKKLEEDLLMASERRKQLENEMFRNLQEHMAARKERVLHTADMLAQLDYWQSLAEVGRRDGWAMPVITENCEIRIREGRHPVVENIIGGAGFVPNDFNIDREKHFCLLTGPNMAGKSTILRQVAIISILAQMGGMVPAKEAVLGIVDRIFSRVGASDNLAQGQSTFMVEMMETARIIRQASKRSLIILDEIGRGTSTYDGMAIAWAVVEDLAARCQGQLRVIFATHYHELTSLEGKIAGLFTMNIAVGSFENNEIVFLHRLLPGPADRSYGVEVARLAGVPYPVVQRARDILKDLEQNRLKQSAVTLFLPGLGNRKCDMVIGGETENLLRQIKDAHAEDITAEKALELIGMLKKSL